jgi:hypothetical protein
LGDTLQDGVQYLNTALHKLNPMLH